VTNHKLYKCVIFLKNPFYSTVARVLQTDVKVTLYARMMILVSATVLSSSDTRPLSCVTTDIMFQTVLNIETGKHFTNVKRPMFGSRLCVN